jgi:DNA-binding IclR family transcriptional regulator
VDDLLRDLEAIRVCGYAVDDQENESGINCLAMPVYATSPVSPSGAVSISALTYRTPLTALVDSVAEIRHMLGHVGEVHA